MKASRPVARATSCSPEGAPSKPPLWSKGRVSYSIRAKEGAVDSRFDSHPSM
jgi:hypothetical protein